MLALLLLGPVLTGCTGGTDLLSKDADWFSRSGRVFIRNVSIETPPLSQDKAVAPDELVSADGGRVAAAHQLTLMKRGDRHVSKNTGHQQRQHQKELQQKHRQASAEGIEDHGMEPLFIGGSVQASKGTLGSVRPAGLMSMPASISTHA